MSAAGRPGCTASGPTHDREELVISSPLAARSPVRSPSTDPARESRATKWQATTSELRHAIVSGQLEVHYQPIVDLVTGAPISVEALVRWRHPTRGLVGPADFIPMAEASGLILPLTEFVATAVAHQTAAWAAAGRPLPCAVNLSVHCLTDTETAGRVTDILAAGGSVTVEVTESVLADHRAVSVLRQLSVLGVQTAIDDFGTGYSCLAALKDLPVKVLKIDRSFVENLDKDDRDLAIITMILQLAWTLGLDVIAEGIETEESAALLRQSGVRKGQGFLYARPMALPELEEWLAGKAAATAERAPEPCPAGPDAPMTSSRPNHLVMFYGDEHTLLARMTADFQRALTGAGHAVLVADEPHRSALRARLPADLLMAAEQEGRLLILDVDDTLRRLMRGDRPNPELFDRVVGSIVRAHVVPGAMAHVHSEMVSQLWKRGNVIGALELEQLWTDLQKTATFDLTCSYPTGEAAPGHARFADLCNQHTAVELTGRLHPPDEVGGAGRGSALEPDATARLAAIVQSSHDAIISKDLQSRITSWNPGAERLYGYQAQEVLGRPSSLLVDPDSRWFEAGMLAKIAAGERTEVFHSQRVHKSGAVVNVSLSMSPIMDADGAVVGVASASRDVGELLEAESRFQDLLEAAPDGIVCADANGVIILANAQLEQLTGFSRQQLIGRSIELIIPAETVEGPPGLPWGYLAAPSTRHRGASQLSVSRKDGTTFPADVSLSNRGVGGDATVTAVIRDVSERLAGEAALRESESRLRQLADSVGVGFSLRTLDPPEFLYASSGVAKVFGIDPLAEDRLPGTFTVYEKDQEWVERDYIALALAGKAASAEFRIVRPDGEVRWIHGTSSPISDVDGVVRRAAGTVEDVTERKALEFEILRRVEFTARMEELAKVGAWALELPTMELIWSDGVFRIYDMDPSTTPSVDLGLAPYSPEGRLRIQTAIDTGVAWDVESEFTTTAGRVIWVRSIGAPVVEDGMVVRLTGGFQDVTEIRRAREDLEQLNRRLEDLVTERTSALNSVNTDLVAANQELESFSYSVSHDLRAPLRSILGFSQILSRRHRDGLDERGKHFLDNILTASQRMGLMIDDLLEYCRSSAGPVRLGPVELSVVFAQLERTFCERANGLGARLSIAPTSAVVWGEPTLVEQILNNLVDNALTYHAETGVPTIEVTAEAVGQEVMLQVSDNGIGISPNYFEKIFEAFQRLHSDENYPGTGIGLASVRKATNRMNGQVTLTSTVGVGTTFSVRLRAAPPIGSVAPAPALPAAPANGDRSRK